MSKKKIETGAKGLEELKDELVKRGYEVTIVSQTNKGFDAICRSPKKKTFRVEAKTSTSLTQLPIQPHHVEGKLQDNLFYVFVRSVSDENKHVPNGFYFFTHEEVKAAWILMPRINLKNGQPYDPKWKSLDWCLLRLHRDRWYKIPE
ncbi:MAG: YkuS family protein [Acidobacteria bacterium]|nr:YkuS family protein [Acidobacteriota bacterium]